MITLYDLDLSGNAYKCRLLLNMLGLEYESVTVDMASGGHRAPDYLKVNPFGQIPALTDGDVTLRDSGAILMYLASKYDTDGKFLPRDPAALGEITGWLTFSANEINNGPTVARFGVAFKGPGIDVPLAQKRAGYALKLMDAHLDGRDWLALGKPTIADIACYPYIALSPEGGVKLDGRDNVLAWIRRFEALPGYIPMPGLPCKAA